MAAGSANITHVAAGPECSAFVTDKGKLYMCGSGDHGRLGLGHTNTARTPLLVSYFGEDHAIEKVACGIAHTLCMTSKGRVFAWGDGTWGNAGIITQSDVREGGGGGGDRDKREAKELRGAGRKEREERENLVVRRAISR
eukprot:746404-Hanusia_phi.AAC.3